MNVHAVMIHNPTCQLQPGKLPGVTESSLPFSRSIGAVLEL